jgi:hypothetical protein
MRKIYLFPLLTLLFSNQVLASDKLSISLALMGQTQRNYRGAQTWPVPTVMAGPSFTFYRKLSLRGPRLNYNFSSHKRSAPWKLNLGIGAIGDGKPLFSLESHNEDFRNQRSSSFEMYLRGSYKFGFLKLFQVGGKIVQDIREHYGNYQEVFVGAPTIKYTKIFAGLDRASTKSNQYAYGPEAVSGIGHMYLKLQLVIPPHLLPWKGIIMTSAKSSWITSSENKNADYVRGRDETHVLSTRMIWNVY